MNKRALSILFFVGGVYGFVRLAIGPFIGFLVGMCELLQNTVYLCAVCIPLTDLMTTALGSPTELQPLYWVIAYLVVLPITIRGGKSFWWLFTIFGFASLIFIPLYLLAIARVASFNTWALPQYDDAENYKVNCGRTKMITNFFTCLANATWSFVGGEMAALAGADCKEVKLYIPAYIRYQRFLLFTRQH